MKTDLNGVRCVVTGGTGFVGSHLTARLLELGASVSNLDIEPPLKGTLPWLMGLDGEVEYIQTDLSNAASLASQVKPDIIFHLAGQPYAPATTLNPSMAYGANTTSTLHALELCRHSNCQRFVLASSACIFGAATRSPLAPESRTFRPEHFYSYSKRYAEQLVRDFREFYDIPVCIARFVNIYGPGDRHLGRIVPSVCRQLVDDRQRVVLRRSEGHSVFEFLHVQDAASGLISVARTKLDTTAALQFGPGQEGRLSVRNLARKLSSIAGSNNSEIAVDALSPERTVNKFLDTGDTEMLLGWSTSRQLDEGMEETFSWYRRFLSELEPKTYGASVFT